MDKHDLSPDDLARLLGEMHAARGIARHAAGRIGDGAQQPSVTVPMLWVHARRAPGSPVSFAVERALRTDPTAAKRYRAILAGIATDHAPLAVAASDGAVSSRRVGEATITIDDAGDGSPPLVIIAVNGRPPGMIEILLDDDSLRLALPEPAAGAILLAADPALPDMQRLLTMLRDARSEIFLI